MLRRDVMAGTASALAAGSPTLAQAQPTPQPGGRPGPGATAPPYEGRHLIVDALAAQGVTHVFGVPGAAVDPIADALIGQPIRFVHTAHEEHAAFMAGAWGRITGRPGVCMATSGPGTVNLAAGLACATAEGDPAVALTGEPPRDLRWRLGNQNVAATAVFAPVAKRSVEAAAAADLAPALGEAFRLAAAPRPGGAHVAVPLDVTSGPAERVAGLRAVPDPALGPAPAAAVEAAARLLRAARLPVVLVGGAGGRPAAARALRALLARTPLPVVEVFEGAGALSRGLSACFVGRVGDHANQPGDALLRGADAVLTVGFDLSEYDPTLWRRGSSAPLVHLGDARATVARDYAPAVELLGDVPATLDALGAALAAAPPAVDWAPVRRAQAALDAFLAAIAPRGGRGVSPVAFIRELRAMLGDEVTVVSDVGSIGLWMVRNFLAYEPRRFLVDSKGWGALGTGLPKAIAAALARPGERVVCTTGDGAFLMGGMEMQTASRLGLPIVQVIWQDGTYDLVKIASEQAFGRWDGFAFRPMAIERFAEAFGARGHRIEAEEQIRPVLEQALRGDGPVMVDLRVDYSANAALIESSRRVYSA